MKMFATTRKDFAVLLMIMIIRMSTYFSSFYALLLVIVIIRIMAAVKSEGKSERNKKASIQNIDTQKEDDSR